MRLPHYGWNANRKCDFFQGDGSKIQNQRFYRSTVKAIEAQRHAENEAAAVKAQPDPKPIVREAPKAEAPKADTDKAKEDSEEMQEIPIAGRTKMTIPKNKDDALKKEKEQAPETDDHAEAKDELNAILKRAPSMSTLSMSYCCMMLTLFSSCLVIVFSKSYCPFSAKAKSILLKKYSIVPEPYVVELDHHKLGRALQSVLGESTGRRTVPNVLVNGKSIGGGDDVSALDQEDQLASTLKNLGGKWIQEVARKSQEE